MKNVERLEYKAKLLTESFLQSVIIKRDQNQKFTLTSIWLNLNKVNQVHLQ